MLPLLQATWGSQLRVQIWALPVTVIPNKFNFLKPRFLPLIKWRLGDPVKGDVIWKLLTLWLASGRHFLDGTVSF